MADILVVRVNMFCRNKELNDIYQYIRSQVENGRVVILPPYCEAMVIPNDMEIRIEDASGKQLKEE